MTEKIVTCDVCGHQINDKIYELTDSMDVTVPMCHTCYSGLREAGLINMSDKLVERKIDEVTSNAD
jgi:hypothetical protein